MRGQRYYDAGEVPPLGALVVAQEVTKRIWKAQASHRHRVAWLLEPGRKARRLGSSHTNNAEAQPCGSHAASSPRVGR